MSLLALSRRGRVWLRTGALLGALGLVAAVSGSSMADPDTTYPNLPAFGPSFLGFHAVTTAYAPPSKQWLQMPDVVLATSINQTVLKPGAVNASCVRNFGAETCTAPPDSDSRFIDDARIFPVSSLPADPRDARFATFPDVTVRTVAFGAIPAEATLSLTLPTGADGLPAGLQATTVMDVYTLPENGGHGLNPPPDLKPDSAGGGTWTTYRDTPSSGQVRVRLKALSVDGVPVGVGDQCRTVTPATLQLQGKGFTAIGGAKEAPAGKFSATLGGTLAGTIDIPRFTDCDAKGDDLSPLVTKLASGSGFPVEVQTGQAAGACWNRDPAKLDWSQCPAAPKVPMPTTVP